LAHAGLEEVGVANLASTFADGGVAVVGVERLHRERVHGLLREDKQNLMLLEDFDLGDRLTVEHALGLHRRIARLPVQKIDAGLRSEDKLQSSV
jgi:hypothetical protein